MATPISLLNRKVTQSFKKDFSKEVILSGSFQLFHASIQQTLADLHDSFEENGFNENTKEEFINRFLSIDSLFLYFEENNIKHDEKALSYIEKVFQESTFSYNQLIKIWHLKFFNKTPYYYEKANGYNVISFADFQSLIEEMKKYNSSSIIFRKNSLDAIFSSFPPIYFQLGSKRVISRIKLNTQYLKFEAGNIFQEGEDVFEITEDSRDIFLTLIK